MASTPVYFGSFNLNDNVNYFVIEKTLSTVPIKQTLFKVARLEGMKKTGAVQNERQISIKLRVVGTSRSNLESLLDTLNAALILPQQNLVMHALDARYFIADCTDVQITLPQGSVVSATVSLTFTAQQPFAFATSASSYTTTLSGWTVSSGVYSANFSVTAGGNVFCRPAVIQLSNLSSVAWSGFSLLQSTDSMTIEVDTGLPAVNGDYLAINCDPTSGNGYLVALNGSTTPQAFLGEFPVLEPTATAFTVSIHAASQPNIHVSCTWTARWLS